MHCIHSPWHKEFPGEIWIALMASCWWAVGEWSCFFVSHSEAKTKLACHKNLFPGTHLFEQRKLKSGAFTHLVRQGLHSHSAMCSHKSHVKEWMHAVVHSIDQTGYKVVIVIIAIPDFFHRAPYLVRKCALPPRISLSKSIKDSRGFVPVVMVFKLNATDAELSSRLCWVKRMTWMVCSSLGQIFPRSAHYQTCNSTLECPAPSVSLHIKLRGQWWMNWYFCKGMTNFATE